MISFMISSNDIHDLTFDNPHNSPYVTQLANSKILQTNDFNVSIPSCAGELGTIEERTKVLMSWMACAPLLPTLNSKLEALPSNANSRQGVMVAVSGAPLWRDELCSILIARLHRHHFTRQCRRPELRHRCEDLSARTGSTRC
jgi:hypothetical protein